VLHAQKSGALDVDWELECVHPVMRANCGMDVREWFLLLFCKLRELLEAGPEAFEWYLDEPFQVRYWQFSVQQILCVVDGDCPLRSDAFVRNVLVHDEDVWDAAAVVRARQLLHQGGAARDEPARKVLDI
jgi:hypothetical protein